MTYSDSNRYLDIPGTILCIGRRNACLIEHSYIPMVDGIFKDIGLKRVIWGFTKQNTFGVGPVVDVRSKEIEGSIIRF
jgi:hypothetical protein